MKLSILIPAYNEKETIKEVLRRVKNADIGKTKKEIIVVDDFSTDGTIEVLKTLDDKNIKIIFHEKNYGKGHAIRTALKHSTGDIIIIQDADLEYNPEDYYKLIEPILKIGVFIVTLSSSIGVVLLNTMSDAVILKSSKLVFIKILLLSPQSKLPVVSYVKQFHV